MKAIIYSDEHVHTYDAAGEAAGEQCHLSRNWSRCTAGMQHREEDFDEVEDLRFYDGNAWVYLDSPSQ